MVGTTRSRIGHFLQKFRELGLIESDPEAFLIVKEANLTAYLKGEIHACTVSSEKLSHSAQY
jgi:hypothetical protein